MKTCKYVASNSRYQVGFKNSSHVFNFIFFYLAMLLSDSLIINLNRTEFTKKSSLIIIILTQTHSLENNLKRRRSEGDYERGICRRALGEHPPLY